MSQVIRNKSFYNWLSGVGLALFVWPSLVVGAELVDQPLFVGSKVQPNVMFVIDDSRSMEFGFMPENVFREKSHPWYYSSKINKVYFDPKKDYEPPLKAKASKTEQRMPDASFSAAWENGYDHNDDNRTSDIHNLNNYFEHKSKFCGNWGCGVETRTFNGAFFYEFDESEPGCEEEPKQNKCYNYIDVSDEPSEIRKKFANWYSYYRNRLYSARVAISEAFNEVDDKVRVGWGAINQGKQSVDGSSQRTVIKGVRPYSSHREEFYKFLYTLNTDPGGTPLRAALAGAGDYYEENNKSWSDDPSADSNSLKLRECRQAHTILMTDGFWNGGGVGDIGNEDGEDANYNPVIKNEAGAIYQYKPYDFWADDHYGTLADVAMHYWKRDLREDLGNYVPTSNKNPAFWQHMVTNGVGLGVDTASGNQNEIISELARLEGSDKEEPASEGELANVTWPNPSNSNNAKIDDLLHASVNSRGNFFTTEDPGTFSDQMSNLLNEIESDVASSSGVSFDVATIKEGALTFAASFDPASWSGDIQALPIVKEKDGDFTFPETLDGGIWSAAEQLDGPEFDKIDRTIITASGGAGTSFEWGNLDVAQKADFEAGPGDDPQAVLEFLRGDRTQEGSIFRERASRLGDIVNSTPAYVGAPDSDWPDREPYAPQEAPYSDFEFNKKDRTPVIYVGANDGMLHGFKATEDGGEEVLAYIPEYLYSDQPNQGLHALADPDYQHQYYVDLPPRTQDVYVDEEWRTILIGGSRTGASGIFALDVTDPADFSESNAADIALWEFSDADDERLGRITQAPIITPAAWGNNGQDVRWTVFLPNGYKSGSQSTGFFMLDLEAGIQDGWSKKAVHYVEFDTGIDATGLSPLKVLDTDADGIADRVYAGDLQGNLWAASSRNGWGSVYSSGNEGNAKPEPLFKARDGKGNIQPITAAPAVTRTPLPNVSANDDDFLVVLGTGEYEFEGASQDDQTQSVYAVRDQGGSGLERDALVPRAFTESKESKGDEEESTLVRRATGDKMDYNSNQGWYIDLPKPFERVTTGASIRNNAVFINSMIPDVNPCAQGGRGWLMAFGLDGRTPEKRVFLEFGKPIVGYQVGGLPNESKTVGGGDKDYRTTTLSDGSLEGTPIPPDSADVAGRLGWRELIQ